MSANRMPALFVGHGSPMNAVSDNRFTAAWKALGQSLPKPRAILMISAHWYTRGTAVTAMGNPKTIHDFGGFPDALFQVEYPAPGSPELAGQIADLLSPLSIYLDHDEWGLDHGAWEILVRMYPEANIPVVQLSIDGTKPLAWHLEMGRKLSVLREQGIMIMGSGNVVHNLREMNWQNADVEAYPWARSFEQFVCDNLRSQGSPHPLTQALEREDGKHSNPSAEHFLPLLYILGTWNGEEAISTPTEGIVSGSLSMLSVQVG
ncbi:4,5-DOPA dioxygenase extradiol [Providencia burhodogranariea]|uniref:LigB family dioxygenase n=1 Tax=Providencia burhodogranariea DSM 19968 TaxID=1141662 RepID=K8WBZ4_9GAMM|nr:4,5-DOPA dioxygenase extradiol [Providencia burhodogranariea]EKT58173.1 LigB family dioxygenase [Providencia burhodogranariea DSM 19968]